MSPEYEEGSSQLGEAVKLIASLRETIAQQSSIFASQNSIIESVRTNLAAIEVEQQYLKSQNAKLQETIGSLQAQLDIISYLPINAVMGIDRG
jgi:chromosome segregation ATPase